MWIISVEILTGCDDTVCEFALCTFNVIDRVVNFSWLFVWIKGSLCATREEITVFVILQLYMNCTLSRTEMKENR